MAKAVIQRPKTSGQSSTTRPNTISLRANWLRQSFAGLVNDRDRQIEVADSLFWLVLLLSLTPLIFSFRGLFGSIAVSTLVVEGGVQPPGWLADPKPLVFLAMAVALALGAWVLRKPIYFAAVATPLVAVYLGIASPTQDIFVPLTVTFLAVAALSLGLFALKGRFLSVPVALFAVLVLFDSVVILLGYIWESISVNVLANPRDDTPSSHVMVPGYLLDDYGASIVDILSFFVLLVSLRFTTHLIKDNRKLALQLWQTRTQSGQALLKALRMWWPLPVAFVILVLIIYPRFNAYVENRAMGQLRSMLLCDPPDAQPPGCVPYPPATETPLEFEPMMRLLVEFSALQMEASATASIEEIVSLAGETTDNLKDKVYPIIANKIFPSRMPGTATSRCSKTNLMCHGANGAKSLANSGYVRLRDPPIGALHREIVAAHAAAAGNAEAFRQSATAIVQKSVQDYRVRASIAIDKAVYGLRLMSIFSVIYSIMVLIKTYGIAFARVIFDYKSPYDLLARISDDPAQVVPSIAPVRIARTKVTAYDESPLALDPAVGFNYYVRRDRQVAGGLGFYAIPLPFKGIRKRLWAGNYGMQYYNLTDAGDHSAINLQFAPAERLIVIRLKRGDRFIFDFPEVLAYSTNLKVRTFVTLSLHGLVFGKAMYRVAEGEGILILYLTGEPTLLDAQDDDSAEVRRDPKSVVAWDLVTPFKIQSKLSIAGLLFSGYNIAKQKGGAAVIHNNTISGGAAKMGVGRFVRTFLSPV